MSLHMKLGRRNLGTLTGLVALSLAACGGDTSAELLPPPSGTNTAGAPASTATPATPSKPSSGDSEAPVAHDLGELPGSELSLSGLVTNLGPKITGDVMWDANGSKTGLGGEGTLDGAVEVVVSKLTAGGQLEAVGKANVQPDGSFEIALSEDLAGQLLIAQVLDAQGKVVGGAVVSVDTSTPGTIAITAESSLEAAVILAAGTMDTGKACQKWECVECPKDEGAKLPDDVTIGAELALDVVTQIDADVVKGLAAAIDAGLDPNLAVQSLAAGFLAGNDAQLKLLAALDVDVDGEAKLAADLIALNGIMAKTAATVTGGADIDFDLTADIAFAPTKGLMNNSNASPATAIQVQAVKDMALNGTLSGLQNLGSPDLNAAIDAMLFAQAKASAAVESQTLVNVLSDLLASGGADQSVIDTITELGEQAVLGVRASADVSALAEVQAELMAALTGQNNPNTGNPLVDLLTGSAVSAAGMLDAGMSVVANFSGEANAALLDLVGVNLGFELCIDLHAKAQAEAAVEVLVASVLDLNSHLSAIAAGTPLVSGSGSGNVDLVADVLAAVGVTLK